MYQRILVPIDGTILSDRAMQAGIELALQLRAAITGFIVVRPRTGPFKLQAATGEGEEEAEPEITAEHAAQQALAKFETLALAAAVPFEGVCHLASRVDKAIIEAAESKGCDLILMVTHGRGAFGEFLYGSQTKAVLANSKLPLLVLR
jgi:nucleotide-binding universal stress UspA family protein